MTALRLVYDTTACEQLDAFEGVIIARNEYRRRVDIATAFAADQDCECKSSDDDCRWHYLLRVLQGDE